MILGLHFPGRIREVGFKPLSAHSLSVLVLDPASLVVSATARSLQSCPTLCDPIPGILQARTLEWVAISFSNGAVYGIAKSRTRLSN